MGTVRFNTKRRTMVQSHRVERMEGDGSTSRLEDVMAADVWESKDSRAPTDTTFWQSDIDSLDVSAERKRALRKALRRHEGENPGEVYQADREMRTDANRKEWKRRQASIYCAQLDMTPYQKRRVRHLVEDVLDFSGFGKYNVEQCILGVINRVAREDGRFIEDEQGFRLLVSEEGVTLDDMRSIRAMIRSRL